MTTRPDCNDCGAGIGEEHDHGCDVARCLATGIQRLSCDDFGCCALAAGVECPSGCHDCGRDIWTGVWPGATSTGAEIIEARPHGIPTDRSAP